MRFIKTPRIRLIIRKGSLTYQEKEIAYNPKKMEEHEQIDPSEGGVIYKKGNEHNGKQLGGDNEKCFRNPIVIYTKISKLLYLRHIE